MTELIEQLNERAHDPKRAIDEGQGITSGGKPVVFVAAPPATAEQVSAAEERLGFRLPDLLRRIYSEVGNGGFGPGYGLLGLPTRESDADESLVRQYAMHRRTQTTPPWPVGLIPLCEWGHKISSFLDCSLPEATVVRFDRNMAKADVAVRVPASRHYAGAAQVKTACWVEAASLEGWLQAWVDGKNLFYLAYGGADESDEDADGDDGEDSDDVETE